MAAYEHTENSSLVVKLQEGLDPFSVGAKSANLGRLIERGFHVPPGCVVTRQALELFLQQTGLLKSVQELVDYPVDRKPAEHVAAYNALCQQILAAPIPQPLLDAITPIAAELLAQAPSGVAVRSSGAQEDSATASFAGIYDSYLGVRSTDDLWMAIRRCWCAAWAPAAIAYTKKVGITPQPDSMAVLVQQLVEADSAGVVFTADPRTGNPWRFTLESTFGLAQDLVGATGTVPADRFVFEWDTGAILEKQIVEKPTQCVPTASGVETVPLADTRKTMASLTDDMATRIAQLALEIDRLFEFRIDIEWVVVNDEIYLVQARPLTALPPFFPHHLPLHGADLTWYRVPIGQFGPPLKGGKVMPPLYRYLSLVERDNRYTLPPAGMIAGYEGVEADFLGHRYLARKPMESHWSWEQKEVYLREWEPVYRKLWLDAKQLKYPDVAAKADEFLQDARSIKQQIEAILWSRDAGFDIRGVSAGPTNHLCHICGDILREFMAEYLPDYTSDHLIQGSYPGLEFYYPLEYVAQAEQLAQYIGEGAICHLFEQHDVGSLLASLIDKYADSPFMKAFEAYCDRFSLLPPSRFAELADGEERPDYRTELHIVREAMQGKSNVSAIYEQATQRRKAYEAEIREELSKNNPGVLERFEQLLDWALFWGCAVNDRGAANIPGYRNGWLMKAMCSRLQSAGLIEKHEDIGYFTAEDLMFIAQTEDLEEGRKIWQRRRHEYEYHDRLQAPECLGARPAPAAQSDIDDIREQTVEPTETDAGLVIKGLGLVTGQASGTACKIETLAEDDTVTDQDVLLFTKPINPTAGYTPILLSLMLRVQGMITQEHLTNTTHIAQIARECGVPIVQISPVDMDFIPSNSMLTLDGSEGTVIVHT